MSDDEFIDIPDREVVVGDRVLGWTWVGSRYYGSDMYKDDPVARIGARIETAAGKFTHTVVDPKAARQIMIRVMLPRPGQVARVPPPPSAWNGKCGKCGKGTYTGLFSVEHEGGTC